MQYQSIPIQNEYKVLRRLSPHAEIYLCNEHASGRLIVIKKFKNERIPFFHKEIEALRDLEGLEFVPRLLFSYQNDAEGVLAIQYKAGKPLHEFFSTLDNRQLKILKDHLLRLLNILHKQHYYSHGDINTHNILVQWIKDKPQIALIDWEFSEKIRNVNIQHYHKFRGTIGITPTITDNSPVNRDIQAVNNIFKLITNDLGSNTKHNSQSLIMKWIQRWK